MIQSLQGLRVLNTRPHKQGHSLSVAIRELGGTPIELPTLEIKATKCTWLHKLTTLDKAEYALFISANAVDYCFQALEQHGIGWPSQIKAIGIGHATINALERHGISVSAMPALPDSEHLLALPCLQKVQKKTIFLFKGEGGRTLIEDELNKRQAKLIALSVYKRGMPAINYQFTNSLWRDNAVDIILITSEQSMLNLFKLFSQEAHSWLQSKPYLVISERLAQAAALFGIKKITISHPNRIINKLFDYKDFTHGDT